VSLSFSRVTGAVVTAVMEQLGHRVERREGTHGEIFPLLGEATLDLFAAAWLPEGHASYWARYGADAMEVATLYDGARFFWGVPAYVPEAEVASVADLARPEVAERMTREIQGVGQGATISVMSQRAIGAYGLDVRGYSFRPGTQAEWLSAYRAGVAQKRWLVAPMWTPVFLNHGGGLRPLRDPHGTFGGWMAANDDRVRSWFRPTPGYGRSRYPRR
jgi:glycine betaine/proline transport system substrate-binding protein